MSAKALSPPPLCVNRNMRKKQVFFSYIKYIFLKLESPETDDFALKKISGCEGKKLVRISINANFITSVMRQSFQKYSENKGFAPPPLPLTEMSVKNGSFFYRKGRIEDHFRLF